MKPLAATLLGVAVFLLLHLAGAREHVGFLSGTRGGNLPLGLLYAAGWFFTVLVAPVVVTSALTLRLLARSAASK